MKVIFWGILVFWFLLAGCDNGGAGGAGGAGGSGGVGGTGKKGGAGNVAGTGVYITGSYKHNGQDMACYWKDGVRTNLSFSAGKSVTLTYSDFITTAITVSEGSIHIAGNHYTADMIEVEEGSYYMINERLSAFYWKDGVITYLPAEETVETIASAIAVSDGSVYIAGYYYYDNNNSYIACYWKDGVKIDLPSGTDGASALAIAISEESVYIAGMEGFMKKACYWKDGVKIDLPVESVAATARGIAVSDGSVYVAGYYNHNNSYTTACYWKDGVKIDLPFGTEGAYAFAITISEDSVYIAGELLALLYDSYGNAYNPRTACYWKDGVRTELPGTNASVKSIAVSKDSIYIAGTHNHNGYSQSCYWKDGVKIDLPSGYSASQANGIAIVE